MFSTEVLTPKIAKNVQLWRGEMSLKSGLPNRCPWISWGLFRTECWCARNGARSIPTSSDRQLNDLYWRVSDVIHCMTGCWEGLINWQDELGGWGWWLDVASACHENQRGCCLVGGPSPDFRFCRCCLFLGDRPIRSGFRCFFGSKLFTSQTHSLPSTSGPI